MRLCILLPCAGACRGAFPCDRPYHAAKLVHGRGDPCGRPASLAGAAACDPCGRLAGPAVSCPVVARLTHYLSACYVYWIYKEGICFMTNEDNLRWLKR